MERCEPGSSSASASPLPLASWRAACLSEAPCERRRSKTRAKVLSQQAGNDDLGTQRHGMRGTIRSGAPMSREKRCPLKRSACLRRFGSLCHWPPTSELRTAHIASFRSHRTSVWRAATVGVGGSVSLSRGAKGTKGL